MATSAECLSREVTNDGVKRRYHFSGDESEEAVAGFVAGLPSDIAGFPFADFSAKEYEDIPGDWLIEVNWGISQRRTEQPKRSLEYKFNFQAPGGHIYQSLATISSYGDPDLLFGGVPDDFGGAINVVNDKEGQRVEGFNLSPPHEVFTLSYRVPDSYITGAYQLLVESLCGKVASAPFRDRPAGSVMLARASGGKDTTNTWTIEFGFGYIDNAVNLPIGNNMVVANKDGFDLLWTYYESCKNDANNGRLKKPSAAYVERVFYRADLNILNLPA